MVSHSYSRKIDVKGEHQHPLFRFLTDAQHGMFNEKIKWNFTKFLVDRQGHVVKRFLLKRNLHNYMKQLKLFYNTKGIQFVLAS